MDWKEAFQINQIGVLSTASRDRKPHGIVVNAKGMVDNKILINICQMKVSLKNLQENPYACFNVEKKDIITE